MNFGFIISTYLSCHVKSRGNNNTAVHRHNAGQPYRMAGLLWRFCTADMIVQRAPVKSHQSQGHVERAVRLVENQYRALLFDMQERTSVEIDPISAASAWILRTSVWLLNRYQPHKGGATSFERLHRKSIQISDSSVVRDGGVFDTIRSKTLRSSRGCERSTTYISINVGWSHRGKR